MVNLRIGKFDDELHKQLRLLAIKKNLKIKQAVKIAIEEWVKNTKQRS